MKKALRLIVSLALSALCLWLAFRNVQFDELGTRIAEVRLRWLALLLLAVFTVQVMRAIRWGVLIHPFAKLSYAAIWRIANLGMLLVTIMPLRLGELARPYMVKREAEVPLTAGLGAVAVERTLDGLLVVLLFFLLINFGLPQAYAVPVELEVAGYGALALFASAAIVIVLALILGDRMPPLLRKLGGRFFPSLTDKVVALLTAFVQGLQALPGWRSFVGLVLLTSSIWAIAGLGFYSGIRAFDLDLPLVSGFITMCVVVLGIMVPAGPAFLGTYQYAIIVSLTSVFAIEPNTATACSLVTYAANIAVVLVLGLPFLFSRSVDLRAITRAGAELR